MKRLRWTLHALKAIEDRGIDQADADEAIAAAELSALDPPHRSVLMRRYFDSRLGRQMLLRVVVEESRHERVIVTVYKTSRIARYLKEPAP